MLVSPAEPKSFLTLGEYSSLVETYGVDFLFWPQGLTCGVQRKTCSDLLASLRGSDRIAREMHQVKELSRAVLLIEGSWGWEKGVSTRRGCEGFLKAQYDGIVLSAQANGVWVVTSSSVDDSIRVIRQVESFLSKESHDSLFRRPKSRGLWGTWRDRDWATHFLQGFEGMGVGNAGALYDTLGLPLTWTVTGADLRSVAGLGAGRVAKLLAALPAAPQSEESSSAPSAVS